MNSEETLRVRVARLERDVARWRMSVLVLAAVIVGPMLVPRVQASSPVDVPAITTSKVTIRDGSGKVRGVFGVDDFSSSDVSLKLFGDAGGPTVDLSANQMFSSLSLRSGPKRPSLRAEAAANDILPVSLSILDGTSNNPRAELNLSGGSGLPATARFGLNGADGSGRVFVSESDSGAYAAFSSKFGSIELDRSFQSEPILKLRGAQGSSAELRFGIEHGEPAAKFKDAAGNVVWEPKSVRPTGASKPKKGGAKEAVDPL